MAWLSSVTWLSRRQIYGKWALVAAFPLALTLYVVWSVK